MQSWLVNSILDGKPMKLQEFTTKEELEKVWQVFHPGDELGAVFPAEPGIQPIAFCLVKEDRQEGLAFGCLHRDEDFCSIREFRINKEHAGKRTSVWFLDAVLMRLKRRQIKRVHIAMYQQTGQKSVFPVLLGYIPYAALSEITYTRQICVKVEDCANFKRMRWYRPGLLGEKGYEMISWKDADKGCLEAVREAENAGSLPEGYLSPFPEGKWETDEETSFLLFEKGQPELKGWLVTERDEEAETITVCRLYISPDVRGHMMGYGFIAGALEEIMKRCRKVCYRVTRGNSQMERFTNHYRHYFGFDMTEYDYDVCNVTVTLQ